MQTSHEFTIKDLVKKPHFDYANFEGENRVFVMFNPLSPQMKKLQAEDTFTYKGQIYQIKVSMPPDENPSKSVQFNCLKVS